MAGGWVGMGKRERERDFWGPVRSFITGNEPLKYAYVMILFSYLSTEWGVYICSSGPESLNQDTGGTKSEHSQFKGSNKKNCFTLSDTDKNHNIILRKYCTHDRE